MKKIKNTKGYTIVEIIIVVAIMGVLLGLVGLSVSIISRKSIGSSARELYTMMGTAQNIAMSKGNCALVIYADSEGYKCDIIYKGLKATTWSVIETATWDETCLLQATVGGTTRGFSSTGQGIVLGFDRATGAFKPVYIYSGNLTAPTMDGAGPQGNCTKLTMGAGDNLHEITLYQSTGKFIMS